MNERLTENIVRNMLREKGYYDDNNIVIEEQQSINPKIDKLLNNASKSGKGKGYPEFIISFVNKPDDLIVIECKANPSFHVSKQKNNYKDYAVDGVLLYAYYLKQEFNVTAIAVSGTNDKEKKISTFLWLREHYTYKDIQDKIFLKSSEINNIIKTYSKPIEEDELIRKAINYNSDLHNYSIPEVERCTLISAILIALQDEPFLNSYKLYTSNKELIEALLRACNNVLEHNNLDREKIEIIISEYSKFKNNNDFSSDFIYNKKTKKEEINTVLRDFILAINEEILPYINESEFDVLGKFYTQFIRYAGSDKKTGLVLTPTHITELFCEIAELSVNDIVFDPCCGTAGFLVSAMNYMLKKAGNDTKKQKEIKSSQLLGIEKRADMFSHACSNMMMRGDGKSHIFYGSCFDERNKNIIKLKKPTKGFLNPPYQDGNADEQLEFVENTLECLAKDGMCIAICQFSTVVSNDNKVKEIKRRLLEKHSLEAVFSMPNDLFYPVGVITCILVFKAHNPHLSNKKTFFGYFKNDGFIKQKNNGRINKTKSWDNIKAKWLESFRNKEVVQGLSSVQIVNAEMEWCAESYMATDYSKLTKQEFEKTIKDYVAFKFINDKDTKIISKEPLKKSNIDLNFNDWNFFSLGNKNFFEIKRAKGVKANGYEVGIKIPFVTTTYLNNGIIKLVDDAKYDDLNLGNVISIANNGSVGESFYQKSDFLATSDVSILNTINYNMNEFLAMFLCTIIKQEKFRYSYGRKWGIERMKKNLIFLPSKKEDGKWVPDFEYMERFIRSLSYSKYII